MADTIYDRRTDTTYSAPLVDCYKCRDGWRVRVYRTPLDNWNAFTHTEYIRSGIRSEATARKVAALLCRDFNATMV